MKNKAVNNSPSDKKLGKKNKANKVNTPIVKAKNVINSEKPKEVKTSPKKLNGNQKITNGSPTQSPKEMKIKKKKTKKPINNESDSDEETSPKSISMFGGTGSLEEDKPKKKNKQQKAAIKEKVEDASPEVKEQKIKKKQQKKNIETNQVATQEKVKAKKNKANSDKEGPPAKKQKTAMSTKQMLKAVDAKRAQVLKDKGKKQKRVGLIRTILDLAKENNLEQLKMLLPTIDASIREITDVDTTTKKRKLRMLMSYKKKIESGSLGKGKTIKTIEKTRTKDKPKVPKPMLDMTQDDSNEESDSPEGETIADKINKAVEKVDDDEDLDEEDEDHEEEEEDDNDEEQEEEDSDDVQEVKKPVTKKESKSAPQQQKNPKKSRYVLFVGNISYDTKEEEVRKHFSKAGKVVSVRMGKDKDSNKSKGFCHIELDNEQSYEKALSMHHTILGSRRINVMYSQGTKEKAKEDKKRNFKVKDMKLKGMKNKGLLAGSTKQSQKRSVRRKKAKTGGGDN